MRNFFLTTALVLPLASMAFAQTATTTPQTAAEAGVDNAAQAADQAAEMATDAANEAADAAATAADNAAEAAADAAAAAASAATAEVAPAVEAPAAEAPATEATAAATLQAEMANSDKIAREQAGNELRLDWITGANVTSPDATAVGQVRDIIVDAESGQMIAAIIGVGGFLGIGEKQIAVPWDRLTINSDAQEITTELTVEEAKAAPDYVFRQREAAPPPAPAAEAPAPKAPAAEAVEAPAATAPAAKAPAPAN